MNMHSIVTVAASTVLLTVFSAGTSQASMSPNFPHASANSQMVDCAAGFHIGPLGACLGASDEERHDTVIEKRAVEDGCQTKSVRRSDDQGNSETRTSTNCD